MEEYRLSDFLDKLVRAVPFLISASVDMCNVRGAMIRLKCHNGIVLESYLRAGALQMYEDTVIERLSREVMQVFTDQSSKAWLDTKIDGRYTAILTRGNTQSIGSEYFADGAPSKEIFTMVRSASGAMSQDAYELVSYDHVTRVAQYVIR